MSKGPAFKKVRKDKEINESYKIIIRFFDFSQKEK